MKINESKSNETVDFESLDEGQCFRWQNRLMIKTDIGQDGVCLDNGEILCDMCDDVVTPVNAEVHIID